MVSTPIVHATAISLVAVAGFAFAACSGSRGATTTPSAAKSPASAPAAGVADAQSSAQAREGAALYAQACARCHGAAGEGSPLAPAVIGGGALPTNPPASRRVRTGTFASAKDIGMFVKDRMPPGSHTPADQTAAILTYLLQSNGVPTTGAMNPSTAASIPWQR